MVRNVLTNWTRWATKHPEARIKIDQWPQILGAGMVSHKERPKILNRLCKLCDQERKLPRSVLVAYESLQAQSIAVDRGGFGDVYRGEYDKHPVAIKVMRFYQCYDRNLFLSVGTPLHTAKNLS